MNIKQILFIIFSIYNFPKLNSIEDEKQSLSSFELSYNLNELSDEQKINNLLQIIADIKNDQDNVINMSMDKKNEIINLCETFYNKLSNSENNRHREIAESIKKDLHEIEWVKNFPKDFEEYKLHKETSKKEILRYLIPDLTNICIGYL